MALVSCFWHFHWTNFAVMLKWLSHMWLRVVGGAWLPRSSGIYSICWIWQLCNLLSKAWNIVEKVCHAHLMLKAWLQGTFVIMTFGGRSLRNFIEISLWTPPNSQNSSPANMFHTVDIKRVTPVCLTAYPRCTTMHMYMYIILCVGNNHDYFAFYDCW